MPEDSRSQELDISRIISLVKQHRKSWFLILIVLTLGLSGVFVFYPALQFHSRVVLTDVLPYQTVQSKMPQSFLPDRVLSARTDYRLEGYTLDLIHFSLTPSELTQKVEMVLAKDYLRLISSMVYEERQAVQKKLLQLQQRLEVLSMLEDTLQKAPGQGVINPVITDIQAFLRESSVPEDTADYTLLLGVLGGTQARILLRNMRILLSNQYTALQVYRGNLTSFMSEWKKISSGMDSLQDFTAVRPSNQIALVSSLERQYMDSIAALSIDTVRRLDKVDLFIRLMVALLVSVILSLLVVILTDLIQKVSVVTQPEQQS